jgi:hypothetical protein
MTLCNTYAHGVDVACPQQTASAWCYDILAARGHSGAGAFTAWHSHRLNMYTHIHARARAHTHTQTQNRLKGAAAAAAAARTHGTQRGAAFTQRRTSSGPAQCQSTPDRRMTDIPTTLMVHSHPAITHHRVLGHARAPAVAVALPAHTPHCQWWTHHHTVAQQVQWQSMIRWPCCGARCWVCGPREGMQAAACLSSRTAL